MLYNYYFVTDSKGEQLYGSYEEQDCIDEIDAEKGTWIDQGYTDIKVITTQVTEAPDPEVYNND